ARVGKTATWALRGAPSPLERELSAMEPSLALVQYGTNDMQFGSTFASALPGFYTSMGDLLDVLLDDGVVPIVFTIPPRRDRADAARWVPMYNLAIRGLAQSRHLPLIDLNLALSDIPGNGLVGDGVHLNQSPSGACDLRPEGLAYAYNNRNAAALTALHRVSTVLDTEDALDAPAVRAGVGTAEDPFVIDSIPFVDAGDTSARGETSVDRYDCASANEGGAEVWYRLDLDEPTALRIMVLDDPDTDVDVHVVGDARDGSGCRARHDRMLELDLEAGVHHIAVDTYVSGGTPRDGEFLLMVAPR
ncbi:MAG: SGNH/GDSL hydrolase family protein, partial [Myxococcota bacterium]